VTRDTGAAVPDVVRAWLVAWTVAGGDELAAAIAGGGWPADVETTCRFVLERTIEQATKWMLANTDPTRPAGSLAAELRAGSTRVRARLPEWIAATEAESFHKLRSELEIAGLPAPLARDLATADWLTGALDVARVAEETGVDPEAAAGRYYALGQDVDFAWLWARFAEVGEEDRWQRRAVEGLVEDLLRARRQLTRLALERGRDAVPTRPLAAVQDLLRDLRAAPRVGLAGLQVVVREIRRLAESG
jgi:glutamate dehydrogenase